MKSLIFCAFTAFSDEKGLLNNLYCPKKKIYIFVFIVISFEQVMQFIDTKILYI